MHTSRFTFHHGLVLVLALFSFGISAYLSRSVFERLPHLEDEVAYLYQARILARGQLYVASPPLRAAFWQPFVLDRGGNRFGKYPLGWPAQLALGETAGAAWLINACLAALVVAMTYRLGSSLFNRDVGAIAATLTSFSPMALLLNSTLMGHTSALFFSLLFIYAFWRAQCQRRASVWGMVAGAGLGMVIANRPLSGLAVGIPLIAWSLARLLHALASDLRARTWLRLTLITLRPLLAMGAVAALFTATIPLFSAITMGDPTANLYTEVWAYDRIGFGECCGRSGHTLEKAFNHLEYDLSLMAADLFGWQFGTWTDDLIRHLQQEADIYPNLGLSWLLLPVGLVFVFRQRLLFVLLWLALGLTWVWFANTGSPERFLTPESAWLWIALALAWAVAPLLVFAWSKADMRIAWAWILAALVFSVLITHMTYWVGSQRYSTRYFFEALPSLAVLTALPLAWFARRVNRWLVYALLSIAILASLQTYTMQRIQVLYRFNNVSQSWVDAALNRATDQRPLLIIMTGTELSWRSMGSFMAVTSPYLDSHIIAAYNRVGAPTEDGLREQLIAQFPDRQVIDMIGQGAEGSFRANSETGSAATGD